MSDSCYTPPSLSGVQVDANLLRDIVQGLPTEIVQTINGPVPSAAKRLAEAAARINYTTKADLGELRNYTRDPQVGLVYLLGGGQPGDHGGGAYYYDAADVTSAEEGTLTVISADGARWKKLRNAWPVDVKWFGASATGTEAQNKAALDAAIAFTDAQGGGRILVPADIAYGYHRNLVSTHPNLSAIAHDITVEDHGPGSTYATPSRDGAQMRLFIGTASASDGLHDGGFQWIRAIHHPGYMVSNDRDLDGAHGDLNATMFFAHQGVATWGIGQGGNSSTSTDPDDLTDFKIIANGLAGGDVLTNVLRISKKTGKIGWNTSNPTDAFSIYCRESMGSTVKIIAETGNPAFVMQDHAGDIAQLLLVAGNLRFGVGSSLWMTLRNDGRVFFGDAADAIGGLTAQYDLPGGYAQFVRNSSAVSGSVVSYLWSATPNLNTKLIEGRGGSSITYRVYGNGTVQNLTGSYDTLSDVRLKQDIEDAPSQWDDVQALRLRHYSLRSDPEGRLLGFVAQEVEQVSPGLVYEDDSPNEDEDYPVKAVRTSVLHTKMFGALQEAMARIETLEAEMKELKNG